MNLQWDGRIISDTLILKSLKNASIDGVRVSIADPYIPADNTQTTIQFLTADKRISVAEGRRILLKYKINPSWKIYQLEGNEFTHLSIARTWKQCDVILYSIWGLSGFSENEVIDSMSKTVKENGTAAILMNNKNLSIISPYFNKQVSARPKFA